MIENEFQPNVPPEPEPPPPIVVAPPPRYPPWTYTDLAVVLGLGIPVLIIVALIAGIITVASGARDKNLLALPAEFVGYVVWFALMALYLRTKYHLRFWDALGWRWQPSKTLAAITAGIALALAVGITGTLLKTPHLEKGLIQELMQNPITRVMVIISATTLGPVCEELLFRGFLLPLLARSFGITAGIMLTALPFALLHGPQYLWKWQLVLLIFLAGCGFGWVRVKTGSTATSTLMHAAYNSVFFITYFFAQKGSDL